MEDLLNKDSSGGMVQRRFSESISTNIPSILQSLIPLFILIKAEKIRKVIIPAEETAFLVGLHSWTPVGNSVLWKL